MNRTIDQQIETANLSRFHYELLLISSLIYVFTAMNVLLIATVFPSIIAEFGLTQQPLASGLLLSAGYLGMFVGALVCGILADRIGRKKTLLFTVSTMTIFTALTALAPDPITMATFRFLAGIGLGGSLPQPGIYISEYMPTRYRGRFLGLVETSWVYGALLSIIFPLLFIPILGWRLTLLFSLIPLFLIPIIYFFLPESLRYLQYRGKTPDAIRLLKKHKLISTNFEEPVSMRIEEHSTKGSLKELFSKTFRRRTLMLWISWPVLVYTYYGIFTWLPTFYYIDLHFTVVRSLQWVLIVTLAQVPGYYTAALLLDKVGRKKIAIIYLAFAGVGSALFNFALEPTAILFFSIVISFFNLGAWSALYAYTPELYPTQIRGTGSGAAASMGRLAGAIAPTATPLLYFYGGLPVAFTVFALIHFIGAIGIATLGIETKGKALAEIK